MEEFPKKKRIIAAIRICNFSVHCPWKEFPISFCFHVKILSHYTILLNHGKLKLGIKNIASSKKHILPHYPTATDLWHSHVCQDGGVNSISVTYVAWSICVMAAWLGVSSSLTYNEEDGQAQSQPLPGWRHEFSSQSNRLPGSHPGRKPDKSSHDSTFSRDRPLCGHIPISSQRAWGPGFSLNGDFREAVLRKPVLM